MRRGMFAMSKTAEWILLLIGLIVLLFFVYFLRDKISEFVQVLLDYLRV
jgi:hypothetical protein